MEKNKYENCTLEEKVKKESNMIKQTVEHIKLYQENDQYFLDVTYIQEDDRCVRRIHIPKVEFPIVKGQITQYTHSNATTGLPDTYLVLPKQSFGILPKDDNVLYTSEIIEEKIYKMTVSEIESKLGYKIQIISEKGE